MEYFSKLNTICRLDPNANSKKFNNVDVFLNEKDERTTSPTIGVPRAPGPITAMLFAPTVDTYARVVSPLASTSFNNSMRAPVALSN